MSLISLPSSCLVSENGLILHLIFFKPSVIDKSLVSILHFLFYTFTSMLGIYGRQCVPLNFEHNHVTCFGQWDVSRQGMSRGLKCACTIKVAVCAPALGQEKNVFWIATDSRAYLYLACHLKINTYFICHCTWAMVFSEA